MTKYYLNYLNILMYEYSKNYKIGGYYYGR